MGTRHGPEGLEPGDDLVPPAAIHAPISLQLFRVTRALGPARTAVEVGTSTADLLYDLRGFHAPERDADPARGTFRWTGPSASLTLPVEAAGSAVTLVVAGGRPPGTPPAEIAVWVGTQLVGERMIADSPEPIQVDLPAASPAGPIALTIQSTVFRPRFDPLELGVRLYRVSVRPTPEPSGS